MIKLSEKIITKYRDKFLVERHNILIEYAEKTKEQGTMYFIYDNQLSIYLLLWYLTK